MASWSKKAAKLASGRLADLARQAGGFRAYHGSPHDFDRFDSQYIGDGEGAQVYGHGLYFAQAEPVAEHYRAKLGGSRAVSVAGVPLERLDNILRHSVDHAERVPALRQARHALFNLNMEAAEPHVRSPGDLYDAARDNMELSLQAAIRQRRDLRDGMPTAADADAVRDGIRSRYWDAKDEVGALRKLREYRNAGIELGEWPGKMYEVQIGYPEESLLDLDAPFSQQPQVIREAYGRGDGNGYHGMLDEPGDGHRLLHNLRMSSSPGEVAQELLQLGIPGTRYWDQESRLRRSGTRNYVIFPGAEDRISILRKYGLLAPVAGGAAAAGSGEQKQPRLLDGLRN